MFLPLGYYYQLPYKDKFKYFLKDFSNALNKAVEEYLTIELSSTDFQKLNDIGPEDAILHYRGGDTRDSCKFEYYRDALKKLFEKENFEKVYILTDDYKRFKKEISKVDFTFELLTVNNVLADFYAVSKAGNVIASNSTFS